MSDNKRSGIVTDGPLPRPQWKQLVHELEVHQEELRTQNAELRATERVLEETRDRYQDLFNHAPVGYIVLAPDGRVLEANETWRRMSGASRDEATGVYFSRCLHSDSAREFDSRFRAIFNNPTDKRLHLRLADDATIVDFYCRRMRWREPDSDVLMATLVDVTEKEAVARRLKILERMEVMGRMTGGVAHDFNNILASVIGFTQLVRQRAATEPMAKLDHYLDNVEKSGERGRRLVRQLLTFSQDGPFSDGGGVELATALREAYAIVRPTLPPQLESRLDVDGDAPPVVLDAIHVQQLVSNLMLNAYEAIDDDGRIAVRLRAHTASGKRCVLCGEATSGNWACIEVEDTGYGIPAADTDRVFEPFFTTKASGSGLGLSVVAGIIRGYHGHILVESDSGRGTLIRLLLPETRGEGLRRADDSGTGTATARPSASAAPAATTAGLSVLVVDDEADIRELMLEVLSDAGYDVFVAGNAERALELVSRGAVAPAAVVTDQSMPGMSGMELSRQLKRIYPTLPIILCTGYRSTPELTRSHDFAADEILMKPMSPDAILDAVSRLIAGRADPTGSRT